MDELLTVLGGMMAFAFVVFILVVALIVWAVSRAVKAAKNVGKAPEYQHIDTDGAISEDQVIALLKRYVHRYGVGDLARAGINALESVKHKRDSFYAALDAKFDAGTISWDRFAVGADNAFTAIVRNTAQLANGVQAFDSDEYKRMERQFKGAMNPGSTIDETTAERWGMLQGRLDGMREIVAGSEKMLLELDKLEAELGKLESAERSDKGDQILQEIRTLSEEMKYYQ